MDNETLPDGTTLRPLATDDERAEAVRLQEETWGAGFSEKMPATVLYIAERTGGVAAGAFSPAGDLLGMVFGLTGVRDGMLVHWSDMLAVRPAAQGRHLGEALKRYQRNRCRAIGVRRMYWTYDPFVAKNARLNLNILGARVDEFIVDMYGTATNSSLHGSLGTDRFVVVWPVADEPTPLPSDPQTLVSAEIVAGPEGAPDLLPDLPTVAVRIPHDYASLLAGDVTGARAWRLGARRAFQHYLSRGYGVTAFIPGSHGEASYIMSNTSR